MKTAALPFRAATSRDPCAQWLCDECAEERFRDYGTAPSEEAAAP